MSRKQQVDRELGQLGFDVVLGTVRLAGVEVFFPKRGVRSYKRADRWLRDRGFVGGAVNQWVDGSWSWASGGAPVVVNVGRENHGLAGMELFAGMVN